MGKIKILLIAGVLILGLLSTSAQATKDYNSSKSCCPCCYSINFVGPFDLGVITKILAEINRVGLNQLTEAKVQNILRSLRIDKDDIKKIILRRKGNKVVDVLLLADPTDLPAAQKALKAGKGQVKEKFPPRR